jgi:hypothetical protein
MKIVPNTETSDAEKEKVKRLLIVISETVEILDRWQYPLGQLLRTMGENLELILENPAMLELWPSRASVNNNATQKVKL